MLQIRARISFPLKGVKKAVAQFSVLPLPFCKPNKKLF